MFVSINITPDQVLPPLKYIGWRVLHKAEPGGWDNTPLGMPEVMPPLYAVQCEMTEPVQRMSYELMRHFNQSINGSKWTNVHGHDKAFNNKTGFNDPNIDNKRRNYILNENTTSQLPTYDKGGRLCGGTFIRGDVVGEYLVCKPGIHGIDGNGAMPSIQTIVNNNWYFFAINYFPDHVEDWTQGGGLPVAFPFIFRGEIKFPLSYFDRWEADELPNHTRIYL